MNTIGRIMDTIGKIMDTIGRIMDTIAYSVFAVPHHQIAKHDCRSLCINKPTTLDGSNGYCCRLCSDR